MTQRDTPAEPTPRRRRPWGLRFTERFLLPFTGPADVGDPRRGTPATEDQRHRARALDGELTRVVGRDGRAYVVARKRPTEPPTR